MADTNTQAAVTATQAAGGAGQALYDSIMRDVEPELTSDQVGGLAEKYKAETPEQAEARGERYQKAFAEFAKRLEAFQREVNEELDAGMREAFASIEQEDRQKEADAMGDLESAITSA